MGSRPAEPARPAGGLEAHAIRSSRRARRRQRRHGKKRERIGDLGQACERFSDRPCWFEIGSAVADAWVEWINVNDPFDWFTTLTFKEDVAVKQSHRLCDRWLARLAQAVRDKSESAALLTSVCATEWTNQRVHLHLVVKAPGLSGHRRTRWCKSWEGLSHVCGMARIYPAA